MYFVKPPLLLRYLTGSKLVWRLAGKEKRLLLTFDDGPSPETTPVILEILDQYGVKAMFFCVGENLEKYPQLLQELLKRGHLAGNHTFHHLNGWETPLKEYLHDMLLFEEHHRAEFFRPPYGKICWRQMSAISRSHTILMWSLLSYDFHPNVSGDQCLGFLQKNTRAGSVVVFHDSLKAIEKVKYALPRYIEWSLEQGYRFKLL